MMREHLSHSKVHTIYLVYKHCLDSFDIRKYRRSVCLTYFTTVTAFQDPKSCIAMEILLVT
jgi:hypothetical protein